MTKHNSITIRLILADLYFLEMYFIIFTVFERDE